MRKLTTYPPRQCHVELPGGRPDKVSEAEVTESAGIGIPKRGGIEPERERLVGAVEVGIGSVAIRRPAARRRAVSRRVRAAGRDRQIAARRMAVDCR